MRKTALFLLMALAACKEPQSPTPPTSSNDSTAVEDTVSVDSVNTDSIPLVSRLAGTYVIVADSIHTNRLIPAIVPGTPCESSPCFMYLDSVAVDSVRIRIASCYTDSTTVARVYAGTGKENRISFESPNLGQYEGLIGHLDGNSLYFFAVDQYAKYILTAIKLEENERVNVNCDKNELE